MSLNFNGGAGGIDYLNDGDGLDDDFARGGGAAGCGLGSGAVVGFVCVCLAAVVVVRNRILV